MFALKLLLTVALLFVGVIVFEWGPRAIRNRQGVFNRFVGTDQERAAISFFRFWASFTMLAGGSAVLAAILLWTRPLAALALVAWPFALFALLGTRNRFIRGSGGCRTGGH